MIYDHHRRCNINSLSLLVSDMIIIYWFVSFANMNDVNVAKMVGPTVISIYINEVLALLPKVIQYIATKLTNTILDIISKCVPCALNGHIVNQIGIKHFAYM
jgi:hypothetical protein